MPSYKYRVLLDNGKIARGKILALNKSQAINNLKDENVQPIALIKMKDNSKRYKRPDYAKIKKERIKTSRVVERAKTANKATGLLAGVASRDIHPFKRVTSKDLIIFVNNFYILKKANFNNVQALEALVDATENPVFKDIVEDILIEVQAGERLYKAMELHSKVFPPVFINFIRVGEESGTLDTALLYARDYVETSIKMKKKIRAAVIPRVLQFLGIMLMMFVGVIVGVPLLQKIYDMFDSTQEIPKATMAMLKVANWFVGNWFYILFAIVLIVVGFIAYRSSPRGRYNVDKMFMLFPVIGDLNRNNTISKFFKAMLLNLKNGMRIQEALEISKNVTNNYYFLSAIETAKANTLSGKSWIEPFEDMKIFKPMITEMVGIGMQTDLSEMMEKVDMYIDSEIDESLQRFIKWLPDITYIFVGIALIAFVVTVMVPIVQVYMGSFIDIPEV